MAREACASSGECGVPEEPVRRQALRPQREVASKVFHLLWPCRPRLLLSVLWTSQ